MQSCHKILLRTLSCAVVIATAALASAAYAQEAGDDTAISAYISPQEPPIFATPEEALATFKSTLEGGDVAKLAALLGLDAAKIANSTGIADAFAAIQAGAKEKLALGDVNDRKIVEVGTERWPFPFPITKGKDGKWAFDTYVGLEEVANRRVGEDELATIDTMRAYVAAQEAYALADRDGDGVLKYARKFISSEGTQDGLYWPAEAFDGEESPAGPALADEKALKVAQAGNGYNGYRYRILTRQGDAIAGGAYDYVINGNMVAGFGLVAWPVHYGVSGVKTFVVNKSGIVYEADLGDHTSNIAAKIETFNPNDDWSVVKD